MSSAGKILAHQSHLSLHLLNPTVWTCTRAGFTATLLKVVLLDNILTSLRVTFHFLSVKFSDSRGFDMLSSEDKGGIANPRSSEDQFSFFLYTNKFCLLIKISRTSSPHLSWHNYTGKKTPTKQTKKLLSKYSYTV